MNTTAQAPALRLWGATNLFSGGAVVVAGGNFNAALSVCFQRQQCAWHINMSLVPD
jgi:hypothetical protein